MKSGVFVVLVIFNEEKCNEGLNEFCYIRFSGV
jgi:hypothetical protein